MDDGALTEVYSPEPSYQIDGAALSPDGESLAVAISNELEAKVVWAPLGTGTVSVLWKRPDALALTPRVSPDGGRIAWVAATLAASDPAQVMSVWLSDADSEKPRLLDWLPDGVSLARGCFSPDGSKMAFALAGPGVYVADIEQGTYSLVADPGRAVGPGGEPVWSSSGNWIAFATQDSRPTFPLGAKLHMTSSDGTYMEIVVGPADQELRSLAWSPVADELAYLRGSNVEVVSAPAAGQR
jgi:Tol biopolymer transport system component